MAFFAPATLLFGLSCLGLTFFRCSLCEGIRLNLEALNDVEVGVRVGDGINELVEDIVIEAEHQLVHVVDLELLHLKLYQFVVLTVAIG